MATNPFLDMVRAQLEMRQRQRILAQQLEGQKELQTMSDEAAMRRQQAALEAQQPLQQAQTEAMRTQTEIAKVAETANLLKSGFRPSDGKVTITLGDNTMTAAPADIVAMQESLATVDTRVKEMAQNQVLEALGLDPQNTSHRGAFELFNGAVNKIGSPGVDLLTSSALAGSLASTLEESLKDDPSPGVKMLRLFADKMRQSLAEKADALLETRKLQATSNTVSQQRWAAESTANNLHAYLVRKGIIPSGAVSKEEQIGAVQRFLQDPEAAAEATKELGVSPTMLGVVAGRLLDKLNAGSYSPLGSVMAKE